MRGVLVIDISTPLAEAVTAAINLGRETPEDISAFANNLNISERRVKEALAGSEST
jgi:hypothetical protein